MIFKRWVVDVNMSVSVSGACEKADAIRPHGKMEIRYDLLRLGTFVQRALGCKMEIRDDL